MKKMIIMILLLFGAQQIFAACSNECVKNCKKQGKNCTGERGTECICG